MSVIGNNIRALRELHGITQQELGEIVGVTRETVNKWETGAIGNVRTSNVDTMRAHFSLSVDDLRSESRGLAARLHVPSDGGTPFEATMVPLMGAGCTSTGKQVEVPSSVHANHPGAFAVVVADDSMARVLPEGCLAVVDPTMQGESGSVVLVDAPGAQAPVVRRLQTGSSKALLCAEGYGKGPEDIVTDLDTLHVLGTVVWFQPAAELA